MSTPSRMCWCDDMACRFTDPGHPCPSPRPLWAEPNGYDRAAVDPTEKWNDLCRVWWPDGAKLSAAELRGPVDNMMREEWARRDAGMLDGLLAITARGSRGQGTYGGALAAPSHP